MIHTKQDGKKSNPNGSGGFVLYWDESSRQLVDGPTSSGGGHVAESKKSSKKKGGSKKGGKGDLSKAINELSMTVEAVEKERNFYFGKLREIEILCQEVETNEDINTEDQLKKAVLEIMYKTDEDGEMVAPDEMGPDGDL